MVIENNLERKKWDELFDKFKKQVHLKKPRTMKGHIDLFLENFGAYYRHRFLEFCLFLKEKGFSLTSCYVEDKIYEQLKKFDKERFDYVRMLNESDLFSRIDHMSGDDFEDFICWLFYRLGYKASKTKAGADQGLAEKCGVELWDRDKLVDVIESSG